MYRFICRGIAVFFCLQSVIYAQVKTTENVGRTSLVQYIQSLKLLDGLGGASIGISVKYADNGDLIAEYNSQQAIAPASVTKLITTSTALLVLGETFRFSTALQYDGEVQNGILRGNLIIHGGGDPTFGSDRFSDTKLEKLLPAILNYLHQKDIHTIEGDIIGDDSVFEEAMAPATWNWGDLGNYYGAGACGLSILENAYTLYFRSGSQAGDSTFLLKTDPTIKGIQLINDVQSGKKYSGDNAYVFGSEYTYLRYARGTIPPNESNFSIKGSLPDPALFAAQTLDDFLRINNITITGEATTPRLLRMQGESISSKDARVLIGEIKSPPLSSIVMQTNIYSNNLFAEHLHKAIGYATYGIGSNYNGNKAIKKFWEKRGLNSDALFLTDGSGLSRNNAISADNFTCILVQMVKEKAFESFYNSLPIAGKSGTLKSVGKGSILENNLRAKSGSMNLVRCYAGYVQNLKGRSICFAILFNNYNCPTEEIKSIIETLMIRIAQAE